MQYGVAALAHVSCSKKRGQVVDSGSLQGMKWKTEDEGRRISMRNETPLDLEIQKDEHGIKAKRDILELGRLRKMH